MCTAEQGVVQDHEVPKEKVATNTNKKVQGVPRYVPKHKEVITEPADQAGPSGVKAPVEILVEPQPALLRRPRLSMWLMMALTLCWVLSTNQKPIL